jgi:hypothetical protein
MRENGMTIDTDISPVLRAQLREAARTSVEDWARRVGPDARSLLENSR